MQFVLQNDDTQDSFAKCSCPHELLWPEENKPTEVTNRLFRKSLSYLQAHPSFFGSNMLNSSAVMS